MAKIVNSDSLQYLIQKIKSALSGFESRISSPFTFKGSCTFEELPTMRQEVGDFYNITNNFTLDGASYPAGSNVSWDGTSWQVVMSSSIKDIKVNGTSVVDGNGDANITVPSTTEIQSSLSSEVSRAQAKEAELQEGVEELDEKIKFVSDLSDIIFYKEKSNRVSVTKTGTEIVVTGKNISDLNLNTNSVVSILGRNRFNINAASFTFNSYSSYHDVTKENGGIKIVKRTLPQNYSIYASTNYVAEISGEVFVSCEAEVEGDIRNLAMIVKVNNVSQTMVYGRGLLYEAVNVSKGDTITISFYSNISGNSDGVLYYKNIMIAYGGLYPYSQYTSPVSNAKYVSYSLPLVANAYENLTTSPATPTKYRQKLGTSYFTVPSPLRPANNDSVGAISVSGLPLISYNATYKQNMGIGVNSSDGALSIYVDGSSKDALVTWLTNNPVSITYQTDEADKNFSRNYQSGEIIISETSLSITYERDSEVKNLNCICFGDSITGMFSNKVDYPTMIEMESDIHCVNVGFAGCEWTDHSDSRYNAFSMNRLTDAIINDDWSIQDEAALSLGGLYAEHLSNLKDVDFKDADFVTIFYGTNDWGSNSILESSEDSSSENKQRTNVEDAVKYTIQNLLTKYPNLRIIIISPYWRAISNGKDSNINPNGRGDYLYEYADKIAEFASVYNLPTLNLYRTFGANAITNRFYTYDGTHPTEWSKHSIAHRLISIIKENS